MERILWKDKITKQNEKIFYLMSIWYKKYSKSVEMNYITFPYACTEMTTFLPETQEGNPLFGKHTKNAVVINNSLWNSGNNWVICVSTEQKLSLVRKLKSMGSQLHRCENLQLVQNCLCRIFLVVYPKKGISFPRFRQKSGHFCACMRKNKVCYTGGRGWFPLVFLRHCFTRAQLHCY